VNVKREGIGQPRPAVAFRFHEKHPHRVGLFLAGLRPLVLMGGILPPGGGRTGNPLGGSTDAEEGGVAQGPRACSGSKRSPEGEAQRTGSERRPGGPE